jgi:hypothetical protein
VILVLTYAWLVSGLRPFTWPSLVAVVGGGLVIIAIGARLRSVSPCGETPKVPGSWGWLALAGGAAVWEWQAFVQHPRHRHPTISSLSNTLLENQPSRMLAVLAWLAAGIWLARR